MRLNYEFSPYLGQSFAQLMKLIFFQNNPKVRHRHVILIYMVAVFLWFECLPHKTNNKFVIVELIFDMTITFADFLTPHCVRVKLMRTLNRMRRYGD